MLTVFQVCFYVGVGLTFLSLILGQFFDFLGIDGLDLDFDIIGIDLLLPLSPILYVLFATVFGGVGWILMKIGPAFPNPVIIGIAIFFGIAAMVFMWKLVIQPLKNAQNTSAPTMEELVGLEATVRETIQSAGFGEITYVIHGNSFSAPAKSTTREMLARNTKVVICWIEDNVFYVSSIANINNNEGGC